MAYATATDLATWLGAAAPADADRLLARAGLEVDYALKGSVYNVDLTGMPTDTPVIAALRDASSAQVEWWLVTQDEVGQFDLDHKVSVTIAGVSKERTPGRVPRLCPRAREILHLAQLLPAKAFV